MKNQTTNILNWYNQNKRDLPWRSSKNPYYVWISEVMLQQTRIEAVITYYIRFLNRLPTIQDLATIQEEELLKLWEGLGYYSRAKNLKKAAIIIEKDYQGIFPSTYNEIIKLPGIGEYTASAIASICFNEPVPTIDGNVLRVYCRVYNDNSNIDLLSTKRKIRENLTQIMPPAAGDFNQALMEIGQTICLPNQAPKCEICPIKEACLAKQKNTWLNLPVRKEKNTKKERKYTILIFKCQNTYSIQKRTNQTLLNNLWQFPMIEDYYTKKELINYLNNHQFLYKDIIPSINHKHIFTHQIWTMTSYIIELTNKKEEFTWEPISIIKEKYAIPSAFQPFLKEITSKTKQLQIDL